MFTCQAVYRNQSGSWHDFGTITPAGSFTSGRLPFYILSLVQGSVNQCVDLHSFFFLNSHTKNRFVIWGRELPQSEFPTAPFIDQNDIPVRTNDRLFWINIANKQTKGSISLLGLSLCE